MRVRSASTWQPAEAGRTTDEHIHLAIAQALGANAAHKLTRAGHESGEEIRSNNWLGIIVPAVPLKEAGLLHLPILLH